MISYIVKRDIEYEHENITYDEQNTEEDGGGIKCKNFEICQVVLPNWWWDCKACYICTGCDMSFGTWGTQRGKGILIFTDNLECPICLETARSVSYPNCEHTLCIKCFKRCWYGDDDSENEPKFPYSKEIENEYYDIQYDNPEWELNYPLIKLYNEEHNEWEDDKDAKYENEEYLRKCPVCRK
jgi:hypothetical protein